jgi:hypothetical protein
MEKAAGLVLTAPLAAPFGAAHCCGAEYREARDRIAKANLNLRSIAHFTKPLKTHSMSAAKCSILRAQTLRGLPRILRGRSVR